MSPSLRRLALTVAMIALVADVPTSLAAPQRGRFIALFEEAMRQAEAAYRARERQQGQQGSSGPQRQLMSIWNPQGCGFSDRSPLTLSAATRIDRIDIWYNWTAGEASSPFDILSASGQPVARGTLVRDSCDPYQSAWCVGTASPSITLPAGSYVVRTPRARICQNAASGNRGFIRAWGGTVAVSSGERRAAPVAVAPALGSRWEIHEEIPGRYWNGVWTRRAGTDLFDAVWRDSQTGASFSDVVELREVSRGMVRLYRRGTQGYYTGTLSPDRTFIRGSASWYPPGAFWTARISGR